MVLEDDEQVKVLTVCQSRKDSIEDAMEDVHEEVRSYGSIMMEQLTGSEEGRIDHALQELVEKNVNVMLEIALSNETVVAASS
ncbi:hypothetical protein Dimus_003396 [Dionaea muscipula]